MWPQRVVGARSRIYTISLPPVSISWLNQDMKRNLGETNVVPVFESSWFSIARVDSMQGDSIAAAESFRPDDLPAWLRACRCLLLSSLPTPLPSSNLNPVWDALEELPGNAIMECHIQFPAYHDHEIAAHRIEPPGTLLEDAHSALPKFMLRAHSITLMLHLIFNPFARVDIE